MQLARLEQFQDGLQQFLHRAALVEHHLPHVNDVEREVVAERTQADRRVREDVALADFQKSSVRRETRDALGDGRTGE